MAKERGRLKIFFGYAAGVGKTYAMLQAALAAREKGIDVVIGSVSPHTMPETAALADTLEQLGGDGRRAVGEFDLDAAILRSGESCFLPQYWLPNMTSPSPRAVSRH